MADASSTKPSKDQTNGASNTLNTQILTVDSDLLAAHISHTDSSLTTLRSTLPPLSSSAAAVSTAANSLLTTSTPVAFPTETVYGLGADATSSTAVRGIFAAKNRPADNPLIVHIASLSQLRRLLSPSASPDSDSIPAIYLPLITRFWPGPLTILLPVPSPGTPRSNDSSSLTLAPEVTAGLSTFGARMPASPLALALIQLTDRPLAAPSANASTRPSPTRAEHVLHDLRGKIEYILDGGDCEVGVESTVVDGLGSPPAVLRPGGVSLEAIRAVGGEWSKCVVGYRDEDESKGKGNGSESGSGQRVELAPRAPGMKYKHYSPSARVVLVKAGILGQEGPGALVEQALRSGYQKVGIMRGPTWKSVGSQTLGGQTNGATAASTDATTWQVPNGTEGGGMQLKKVSIKSGASDQGVEVIDAEMGRTAEDMARNLFRGLREMDLQKVDLILVEGVDDSNGEAAAAVMNRLRKAAEIKIDSMQDMPF